MKRFAFSLQYLADLHAARQQQAEQALSEAFQKQNEAEEKLQFVIGRRNRMVREIEALEGRVKRSEWSEKVRHVQDFERQVGQCRWAVQQALKVVEECRQRLNDELKECRILEKIEKSERTKWSEAMNREDQKQMDELAAGRWIRQEVTE